MANESISVKPGKDRLINLLETIGKGDLKIPVFQRAFVWTEKEMLELFDSIANGYPIGSLLFWKPREQFQCYDTFGPYTTPSQNIDVKYLLDGFQRLSTLFGVLSNPAKYDRCYNQGDLVKFSIYYDLTNDEFTYQKKKVVDVRLIPLYVLIDTFEFLNYMDVIRSVSNSKEEASYLINKAQVLAKAFIDYEIPFIDIRGGDIVSAVEIFSRINSTGLPISTDWMVSALSFNPNKNFHFIHRINSFLIDLEPFNFENLNRETILHCIEASTNKSYFDVKIEELARRPEFPSTVNYTLDNIKRAVNFLYDEINVIDLKLVPYNLQIIFLCEFFRLNPAPVRTQLDAIVNWFWVTSYTNYFTVYATISKQRLALDVFRKFARGEINSPIYFADTYKPWVVYPIPEKIDLGSVRCKSLVLFMLNHVLNTSGVKVLDQRKNLEIRYLSVDRNIHGAVVTSSGLNCSFDVLLKGEARKNDASQLLSNPHKHYPEFFISEEMTSSNNVTLILEERFRMIRDEEKAFVEHLGLAYS